MNKGAGVRPGAHGSPAPFDVEAVRRDFPVLHQQVHGHPLVYLDNAATTQKPRQVLEAIDQYYRTTNSNIHRGVHHLSQKATDAYEGARGRIAKFLGITSSAEAIFVRGATEGINLVASSYGRHHVGPGDEVIISAMEHHSNIVPWQMLCSERKASLRVVPMSDEGEADLDAYEELLSARTKIVAFSHVSNALGTINDVKRIVGAAHDHGIPVLLDGAQAAPHLPLDLEALGCDFYVISGHKLYGPTGIGLLYGREELLEAMPPYQGGGDMIKSVTFDVTTYNDLPHKFEAGTPDIAGVIGLGAAVDYLQGIGMEAIGAHEAKLLSYGTRALQQEPRVRLIGTAPNKAGVLSFLVEGVHPHDIGTILDRQGIAIRAGHHCAQPVMDRLGIPATARASLALYNTTAELDALLQGIRKVKEVFGT